MRNIEQLMAELVRTSVHLKRKLYRRDMAASTTPDGIDGPRTMVHTCRVCDRSAAGMGAQVQHKPSCELARMQRAQAALREAWPELFEKKPDLEERAPAPGARHTSERCLPRKAHQDSRASFV